MQHFLCWPFYLPNIIIWNESVAAFWCKWMWGVRGSLGHCLLLISYFSSFFTASSFVLLISVVLLGYYLLCCRTNGGITLRKPIPLQSPLITSSLIKAIRLHEEKRKQMKLVWLFITANGWINWGLRSVLCLRIKQ